MTARLRDAVDLLTRDRPVTVQTDDGTRYVQSTALLTQLRQSYLDTNSGAGGGATARLPIDIPATDLLNYIEAEVTDLLAGCTTSPRKGTTEQKVRRYGAAILAFGAGEIAEAERIVTHWVVMVEGLLYPARKRRPLGQPCPACGNMWVLGDAGRVAAVTYTASIDTHTDTWEAHCAACNVDWVGQEIGYLLKAVAS